MHLYAAIMCTEIVDNGRLKMCLFLFTLIDVYMDFQKLAERP